ncbi:MAG: hypothetical protein ACR2JB_24680 [Bryobacteraceae bacterium]
MPRYRIHRLEERPSETFRWAPHTGGLAIVKSKDYEVHGEVDGSSPYAVWKALLAEGRPLRPGDLLERNDVAAASGQLYIAKYIGFEPASWYVPEPQSNPDSPSGGTSESAGTPLQSDPV